jgi:hypothetical protein
MLLSEWWSMAGSAGAASYPPALGCGVSGLASANSAVVQVRGVGFAAGSVVLVSVAGQSTGATRTDAAGSFGASWPLDTPAAGAPVTAADAECSATATLTIENQPLPLGKSALPPIASGSGSVAGPGGPATPAHHPRTHPSPAPTSPEPLPPARRGDPARVAIPSVPLTGLPPQLFLGLAAAVLVAGAAATGLTGRLGHRGQQASSES